MIAVRSVVKTEFAYTTFLTECRAVGTVFSANIADSRTVTAVMAVLTHCICTVDTDATVGTVFIHTVGAFAAIGTTAFRAVMADDTTVFAEIGTVTAQKTVFTQEFIHTIDTKITGSAECITAARTHFLTFRAEIRTVSAALTAGANNIHTAAAQTAVYTEIVLTDTIDTKSTVRTKHIFGTIIAFLTAVRTEHRTFRAALAAFTDVFGTVRALSADDTESVCTVNANAAFGT